MQQMKVGKKVSRKQRTRAHLLPRSCADLRRSRRYQSDTMEDLRLRLDGAPVPWRWAQERNGRTMSIVAMRKNEGRIQGWLERGPSLTHSWLAGYFRDVFWKGNNICSITDCHGTSPFAEVTSNIEVSIPLLNYEQTYLWFSPQDLASLSSLIAVQRADSGVHKAYQELNIKC